MKRNTGRSIFVLTQKTDKTTDTTYVLAYDIAEAKYLAGKGTWKAIGQHTPEEFSANEPKYQRLYKSLTTKH